MLASVIRQIGSIVGDGPSVVFIGGLHGNEPAGVYALQRFFAHYDSGEFGPVRGKVCGVVGNLRGLVRGRRYLRTDLNRHWTEHEVAQLRGQDPEALSDEDHERLDLLHYIESLPVPTTFVDLHTTSGDSAPFSVVPDKPADRVLAAQLEVPAVLGLSEELVGNLVSYVGRHGHVGIGIEGGAHLDPESVGHHEAIIMLTLAAMGCIEKERAEAHRHRLIAATVGHPIAARVVFRHGITEADCFVMEPGLSNFQPVARGQVVARDVNGPILVPMDGLMMLPKYQGQGDDGYFIAHHAAL